MKPNKRFQTKHSELEYKEFKLNDSITILENSDWMKLKDLPNNEKEFVNGNDNDYFIYRAQENGSKLVYSNIYNLENKIRVIKDSKRFDNSILVLNFEESGFSPLLKKDLTNEEWVIKCVSTEIEELSRIDSFNPIITLEYSENFNFSAVLRVLLTIYNYSFGVTVKSSQKQKIQEFINEDMISILIEKED